MKKWNTKNKFILFFVILLNLPIPFMLTENWYLINLISENKKSLGTINEVLNGNDIDIGHEYIYKGKFTVNKDTFDFKFIEISGITDKSSYYYLNNHDYNKGDKIEILYNKNNPNENTVNFAKERYAVFIYSLIIVLFDLFSIFYIFKMRKKMSTI